MAAKMRKTQKTPIRQVAVRLACKCSCWADCGNCSQLWAPSGTVNSTACANAYYAARDTIDFVG